MHYLIDNGIPRCLYWTMAGRALGSNARYLVSAADGKLRRYFADIVASAGAIDADAIKARAQAAAASQKKAVAEASAPMQIFDRQVKAAQVLFPPDKA